MDAIETIRSAAVDVIDTILGQIQRYRQIRGGHWVNHGFWQPWAHCERSDQEQGARCERWYRRRPQRTFCWCPGCTTELCSQPDSVRRYEDDGTAHYECQLCGEISVWDFGAPAPLLLSHRRNPGFWLRKFQRRAS